MFAYGLTSSQKYDNSEDIINEINEPSLSLKDSKDSSNLIDL
jgi:hypothetical protein